MIHAVSCIMQVRNFLSISKIGYGCKDHSFMTTYKCITRLIIHNKLSKSIIIWAPWFTLFEKHSWVIINEIYHSKCTYLLV